LGRGSGPAQENSDRRRRIGRTIVGGLNYYVHGDNVKVMADYVHTWSDFRQAHPQLGDNQFDELLLRIQVVF
jgi:hypothetical protein